MSSGLLSLGTIQWLIATYIQLGGFSAAISKWYITMKLTKEIDSISSSQLYRINFALTVSSVGKLSDYYSRPSLGSNRPQLDKMFNCESETLQLPY